MLTTVSMTTIKPGFPQSNTLPRFTPGEIIKGGVIMVDMSFIGARCRRYRRNVLKVELQDVASTLGYSRENISAFESGRNDNSLILLWYLSQGLTYEQLTGGAPIE